MRCPHCKAPTRAHCATNVGCTWRVCTNGRCRSYGDSRNVRRWTPPLPPDPEGQTR